MLKLLFDLMLALLTDFGRALAVFILLTLHSTFYWFDYGSTQFQTTTQPIEYDFIVGQSFLDSNSLDYSQGS